MAIHAFFVVVILQSSVLLAPKLGQGKRVAAKRLSTGKSFTLKQAFKVKAMKV